MSRNAKAPRAEGEDTAATAAGGRPVDAAATENVNSIGADEKFKSGPFSLLYNAVHDKNIKVLILCRNQKRVLARVRGFDRHFNMLLQDAQEISTETDAGGNHRMRSLNKLFLRGDSVISVVSIQQQGAAF
jgi:small nuclear ribonucleoprotein D2